METTNPDYTGVHFYIDMAVNGVIGSRPSKIKSVLLPNVDLEANVETVLIDCDTES